MLRPYSPKYRKLYEDVEKKILASTGDIDIHHVGSTAVVGMGGKGVIDILVGFETDKECNLLAKKLKDVGFIFQKRSSPDRMFLSNKVEETREGDYHIHLTRKNSSDYINILKFRDVLRQNPEVCEAYLLIKKKSAAMASGERSKYTKNKAKFIQKTLDKYR